MSRYQIAAGKLLVDGQALFSTVPAAVTLLPDERGVGAFLQMHGEHARSRHEFDCGRLEGLGRFTGTHRYEPYWMVPQAGDNLAKLRPETQFLLAELTGGRYLVVLPLIDHWFRCSLRGKLDHLAVVAETGASDTAGLDLTGAFLAVGDDPYALIREAAASVMARLQTGRLRREKPLPEFVDEFGWCTWDAYYTEVSHEKVLQGLASFTEGGVRPRFLILDDGWQSVLGLEKRQRVLTSFAANPKFPGGLSATLQEARERFGLHHFLVWHSILGYWNGADARAFTEYAIEPTRRQFSEAILASHNPGDLTDVQVGLVCPESVDRFFNDYHRYLRQQGVDGVKVDSQAILEALGDGHGGRVVLSRQYREALEGSVQTHLRGNLINCMSGANEMIYQALGSTITRTSTDFWPNRPASHGLHVYTNALVGLWVSEFLHPDWDMFQSGHALGAFHAAARAISGGPVYCSDKPDGHDFKVLRKLVLSDGTVLRCPAPALPCRDSLFGDPCQDQQLLKIFNHNRFGGVVGAFNCQHHEAEEERQILAGHLTPGDVEGLAGERFAVWTHYGRALTLLEPEEKLPIWLSELTCELFTVMPVMSDFAPLGLADKFNGGGAITACRQPRPGLWVLDLRDGGEFVAWSAREPDSLSYQALPPFGAEAPVGRTPGDEPARLTVEFTYDGATGLLTTQLPANGPLRLTVAVR